MGQSFLQGGCSFDDIIELAVINVTESAAKVLSNADIYIGLFMHSNHNWGKSDDELCRHNDEAFKNNGRVVSLFKSCGGTEFAVFTDLGDVNTTTIALAEEFKLSGQGDL